MSTWFLKSKTPNNKEKKKINNSIIHNLNTNSYLNIYNPFNNIKFTKDKKVKKIIYTILYFLKIKYHMKTKKFRINQHKKILKYRKFIFST